MLAAFFGDCHGHLDLMFQTALDWQERTKVTLDFIVQVGDFGIWPTPESIDKATAYHMVKDGMKLGGDFQDYLKGEKQVPLTTFFCRGNHEYQPYLREKEKELEKASPHNFWSRSIELVPNLFYIPDGHIIEVGGDSPVHYVPSGTRMEHNTIRIAAWGGNFAWKTWNQDMPYWRTDGRRLNHMTKDRFAKLIDKQFDVLLTHDAPTGSGVVGKAGIDIPYDEQTGNGCQAIRELIDRCQPRFQVNGHWHEFHYNEFGRTKAYVLDKVSPRMDVSRSMLILEL